MEATEKAYFCYKYIMFDMDVCFISARCWEVGPNLHGCCEGTALGWPKCQETKHHALTALVHGQQLVTEATPILFSSALSSSRAQISNCCSIACLIGKEGGFSRGCDVPARRNGVC